MATFTAEQEQELAEAVERIRGKLELFGNGGVVLDTLRVVHRHMSPGLKHEFLLRADELRAKYPLT